MFFLQQPILKAKEKLEEKGVPAGFSPWEKCKENILKIYEVELKKAKREAEDLGLKYSFRFAESTKISTDKEIDDLLYVYDLKNKKNFVNQRRYPNESVIIVITRTETDASSLISPTDLFAAAFVKGVYYGIAVCDMNGSLRQEILPVYITPKLEPQLIVADVGQRDFIKNDLRYRVSEYKLSARIYNKGVGEAKNLKLTYNIVNLNTKEIILEGVSNINKINPKDSVTVEFRTFSILMDNTVGFGYIVGEITSYSSATKKEELKRLSMVPYKIELEINYPPETPTKVSKEFTTSPVDIICCVVWKRG